MAERSVAVEVKIKGMKWEDFNDNEYIENLVNELKENGQNVVVGKFDELINWGRSNSLWPLTFATSCCGIEFISLGAARYDMARFGFEVARSRLICCSRIWSAIRNALFPKRSIETPMIRPGIFRL